MRALDFLTGHMTYNLAYTKILQTTTTIVENLSTALVEWNKA